MLWSRIVSLVSPILFFVFLQLADKFAGQVLYWGMAALIAAALALVYLRRIWLKEKIEFKIFWLSSFLFLLGSFLIFVFLSREVFRQVVIFFSSLLFFLQLFYATLFLRERKDFYLSNMAVLNEIFPVLAFLLLANGFYDWLAFLSRIMWIFLILVSFVALQGGYNLFFNAWGRNFYFAPLWITTLITAELFWALDFLSVGFFIKGLLLTIVWCVVIKVLAELYKTERKKVKIYVFSLLALILVALILLNSRWI